LRKSDAKMGAGEIPGEPAERGGKAMYTCAYCTVLACGQEHPETMPANCPMRDRNMVEAAFKRYEEDEVKDFYICSSEIESLGYGQWVRVKETMEFCRKMGYHRIGLAFCKGLRKEARILADILKKNGFDTVSVICKTGGIDKTRAGIPDERKIHPGGFEPMCNPILQAELLNGQKTEFNIALGLCVGHDSLFYKNSQAMVTTLVVKDRVLAHNPAGALYCAEGYYSEKLQ
jgi:uncharacterized metal-binding protein